MPQADEQPQASQNGAGPPAPPSAAETIPSKVVLGSFRAEFQDGPGGGKILLIHHYAGCETIIAGMPPAEAERLAREAMPSKVEVPGDGAARTPGGIVL